MTSLITDQKQRSSLWPAVLSTILGGRGPCNVELTNTLGLPGGSRLLVGQFRGLPSPPTSLLHPHICISGVLLREAGHYGYLGGENLMWFLAPLVSPREGACGWFRYTTVGLRFMKEDVWTALFEDPGNWEGHFIESSVVAKLLTISYIGIVPGPNMLLIRNRHSRKCHGINEWMNGKGKSLGRSHSPCLSYLLPYLFTLRLMAFLLPLLLPSNPSFHATAKVRHFKHKASHVTLVLQTLCLGLKR